MKKPFTLFAIFALVVSLTACNQTEPSEIISGGVNTSPYDRVGHAQIENTSLHDKKSNQITSYIDEKNYPALIGELLDKTDSTYTELLKATIYAINGRYLSAGAFAVAGITDKMSFSFSSNEEIKLVDYSSWLNVRQVNVRGASSIAALLTDGRIHVDAIDNAESLRSSGNFLSESMADVVDAVSQWSDICSFDMFYPESAIALSNHGEVYVAYSGHDGYIGKLDWTNIIEVYDGRSYAIGLHGDGTVSYENYRYGGNIDVSEWSDIVSISCSWSVIGLKEDGTVVSTGDALDVGQGTVDGWENIIAVSTCEGTTLGLRNNGTVVFAGDNRYGQGDVTEWIDVVMICASPYFSVGLTSDGAILLAGSKNGDGISALDIANMKNLYTPQLP